MTPTRRSGYTSVGTDFVSVRPALSITHMYYMMNQGTALQHMPQEIRRYRVYRGMVHTSTGKTNHPCFLRVQHSMRDTLGPTCAQSMESSMHWQNPLAVPQPGGVARLSISTVSSKLPRSYRTRRSSSVSMSTSRFRRNSLCSRPKHTPSPRAQSRLPPLNVE